MASTTETINIKLGLDISDIERKLSSLESRIEKIKSSASRIPMGGAATGPTAAKNVKSSLGTSVQTASKGLDSFKSQMSSLNAQFKELSSSVQSLNSNIRQSSRRPAGAAGGGGAGAGGGRDPGGRDRGPGFLGTTFQSGDRRGFMSRVGSVAEFAVASKVVSTSFAAIAGAFNTITGVDDELKELNKVLTTSDEILKGLRDSALQTGKAFGASTKEVLSGFKVFAQQGLQPAEVAKRGKAVSLATNVTTLTTQQAAEAITAGLKVFNEELNDSAESMIDSFLAVESQNAVTAGELADVMQRIGSAAQQAGVSFDELSAVTTVIKERTRAPSSTIARALKFMIRNLSRGPVEAQLTQLGVATTDTSGQLRDAFDILKDLAEIFPTLSRRQKQNLAVQIGGTRFIPHFTALMEDFGKTTTIVEQSQTASGTAMEKNAIIMQSFSKQVQKTRASFEGLAISIGDGLLEPLTAALSITRTIVDTITKISNVKLPFGDAIQGAAGFADTERTGITVGDVGGALIGGALIGGLGKVLTRSLGKGKFAGLRGGALAQAVPGQAAIGGGVTAAALGARKATAAAVAGGAITKLVPAFSKLSPIIKGVASKFHVLALALAAILPIFNRLTETGEESAQRLGLNAKRQEALQNLSRNRELQSRLTSVKKLREQIEKSGVGPAGEELAKERGDISKTTKELNRDFSDVSTELKKSIIREGLADQIKEIEVDKANNIVFSATGKDALGTEETATAVAKLVEQAQKQIVADVALQKSILNFSDRFDDVSGESSAAEQLGIATEKIFRLAEINQGPTKQSFLGGVKVDDNTVKQLLGEAPRSDTIFGRIKFAIDKNLVDPLLNVITLGGASLVKDAGDGVRGVIGPEMIKGLTDEELLLVQPESKKELEKLQNRILSTIADPIEKQLSAGVEVGDIVSKQINEFLGGGEGFRGISGTFEKLRKEGSSTVGAAFSSFGRAIGDNVSNLFSDRNLGFVTTTSDRLRTTLQELTVDLDSESKKFISELDPRSTSEEFFTTLNKVVASRGLGDLQAKTVGIDAQRVESKEAFISKAAEGDIVRVTTQTGKVLLGEISKGLGGELRVRTKEERLEGGQVPTDIQKILSTAERPLQELANTVDQVNVELFKTSKALKELTAITATTIRTGFGAGQAIAGAEFKIGADDLTGLSDQIAGTFSGFTDQGLPTFNKGLKQFLIAARANQETNDNLIKSFKDQPETVLTKDSPTFKKFTKAVQQEEVAGFIARAVEGFGSVIKTFQQAVNNFSRSVDSQRAAQEIPITTVGPLSQQGLGRLPQVALGKLEEQLTPLEKTFTRIPEVFKQLSNFQTVLRGARDVRQQSLVQVRGVKNLIDKGSASSIKAANLDFIKEVFKDFTEGVPSEKVGSLLETLVSGSGMEVGAAREELSSILTQSIESLGQSAIQFGEKIRTAAAPLERTVLVGQKLSELAQSAEKASQALEDLEAIQGVFDNISQAMGEGLGGVAGPAAPTIFAGGRRGSPSEATRVDLSRLTNLQAERRIIEMRSSEDVRRGERELFDANFQRLSPLTEEQRSQELRKLRVRQEKETLQNTRKTTNAQLQQYKQSGEKILTEIERLLVDPNVSQATKEGLKEVRSDLRAFGKIDPRRLVTGTGSFNERMFGAFDRAEEKLDSLIVEEGKRLEQITKTDPSMISKQMEQALGSRGALSTDLKDAISKREAEIQFDPVTSAIEKSNTALQQGNQVRSNIDANIAAMAAGKEGAKPAIKRIENQQKQEEKQDKMTRDEKLEFKRRDPVGFYKKFFPLIPELAENAKKFIKEGSGLDRFVAGTPKPAEKQETANELVDSNKQQIAIGQKRVETEASALPAWRTIASAFSNQTKGQLTLGGQPASPVNKNFIPGLTNRFGQELAADYSGEAFVTQSVPSNRLPERTRIDVPRNIIQEQEQAMLRQILATGRTGDRLINTTTEFPKKEFQNTLQAASARDPEKQQMIKNLENINSTAQTQLKEQTRSREEDREISVNSDSISDAINEGAETFRSAFVSAGQEVANTIAGSLSSAIQNSSNSTTTRSSAEETGLRDVLNQFIENQRNEFMEQTNKVESIESKLNIISSLSEDFEASLQNNTQSISNLISKTDSTNDVVTRLEAHINTLQGSAGFFI